MHSETVHHRRQNAHVVGTDAVHPLGRPLHAAEDVTAADDEAHLGAGLEAFSDLGGDPGNGIEIDAIFARTHERLARDFEQHALEGEFSHELSSASFAPNFPRRPRRGGDKTQRKGPVVRSLILVSYC